MKTTRDNHQESQDKLRHQEDKLHHMEPDRSQTKPEKVREGEFDKGHKEGSNKKRR